MRATKQFNNVDTQSKITINTDELRREGQSIPEEAYTCSQAAGLVAAMKGAVPCRV